MELGYHLAGMLYRDQRTAKFCVRDDVPSTSSSSSCTCGESYTSSTQCLRLRNQDSDVSHNTVPGRTSPSTFRIREKEHRHFWVTTLSRLHRTVLLCFYLSLVIFPKTSSAPIKMEKWMIPCGKSEGGSNSNQAVSNSIQAESNSIKVELLQAIIEQSKRSLVKVEAFKEKFAEEVFNMNWSQVEKRINSMGSMEWLPKIEKELGKPLSEEELDKLELNTTLKDTYQYLQKIAMAVDQMIIDAESKRLARNYRDHLEWYVLSVLCEIQTAANTLNVARHEDVQRTIVDEVDKGGDSTARSSRHYMIIRNYVTLLEYIIESYEHLKSKL